jgi:hypothetical protein
MPCDHAVDAKHLCLAASLEQVVAPPLGLESSMALESCVPLRVVWSMVEAAVEGVVPSAREAAT